MGARKPTPSAPPEPVLSVPSQVPVTSVSTSRSLTQSRRAQPALASRSRPIRIVRCMSTLPWPLRSAPAGDPLASRLLPGRRFSRSKNGGGGTPESKKAGLTDRSLGEEAIIDPSPHLVSVDRQFGFDSLTEGKHFAIHDPFHPPLPARPRKLAGHLRSRLLEQ